MLSLTLGANFVSSCPDTPHQGIDFHLSTVSCTSHECNRTQTPHSCEQECHHDFCNDQSVFESSNRTKQFKLDLFTSLNDIVVLKLDYETPVVNKCSPECTATVSLSPVPTPLRI
jgi:hypothetical protein